MSAENTDMHKQHYIWFDAEFTGLNLDAADFMQLSIVVTDTDLQRISPPDQDLNIYIKLNPAVQLSPWIQDNLKGVIERCKSNEAIEHSTLNQTIADYLDNLIGPPSPEIRSRPVLAGNSIHNDWILIRRHLPALIDRTHYRHMDATCFKLAWQNWYGEKEFDKSNPTHMANYFEGFSLPGNAVQHDAYYDVQASIAELGYYRKHMFK